MERESEDQILLYFNEKKKKKKAVFILIAAETANCQRLKGKEEASFPEKRSDRRGFFSIGAS